MSDSTNVERQGYAMSERMVGDKFNGIFKGCKKRIIVATFASNVPGTGAAVDPRVQRDREAFPVSFVIHM